MRVEQVHDGGEGVEEEEEEGDMTKGSSYGVGGQREQQRDKDEAGTYCATK